MGNRDSLIICAERYAVHVEDVESSTVGTEGDVNFLSDGGVAGCWEWKKWDR